MKLAKNAPRPHCLSGNTFYDIQKGWVDPYEILESEADALDVMDAFAVMEQFSKLLNELKDR